MGKKRKKKHEEPDSTKIIMRIGLYSFLVIAVIGIGFEARARSAAIGTRDAWRDAREKKYDVNDELFRSELSAFLKGSPSIDAGEVDDHKILSISKHIYTWRGPFLTYDIHVYMGHGETVEFIEGPGAKVEN